MKQSDAIHIFCTEIWKWFNVHKRSLPWRDLDEKDENHRAYLVLVSEVMLQQTQVSRVIILYRNFLEQFPRMTDLAAASNADILRAWKGLGYNSRALRLRDAIRFITEEQKGIFPKTMDDLMKIKGIGHYTAAAVRNFAFGLSTPCLDTNIRRILHRFLIGPEKEDGTWQKKDVDLLVLGEKVLQTAEETRKKIDGHSLRQSISADWHAALMDFGSLVCTKNNPKWELLSPLLASVCKSYGWKSTTLKRQKKEEPGRMMAGRFIPRRIVRGRMIEALRNHSFGLTVAEIGPLISVDEEVAHDHQWIESLLVQLQKDGLVQVKGEQWMLSGE